MNRSLKTDGRQRVKNLHRDPLKETEGKREEQEQRSE